MYEFIQFPGDLGRQLRSFCENAGEDTADVVRRVMQEFLEINKVEVPPPAPRGEGLEGVVQLYLTMRDACAEINRKAEEAVDGVKEKMQKVSALLMKKLNDNNVKNMRTDAGTFYKSLKLKPSVHDWDAFYSWIGKNNTYEFLERRVTKTAIEAYSQEHEGKFPPGVSAMKEFEITVTRSNSSKGK